MDPLFRTLIAAKIAPFAESYRPSSRGPYFSPKFGQSPDAISSAKRGHFGDTWIVQDPPKILGESWAIYRRMGGPYFEL